MNKNNEPSIYTILYWLIQEKVIKPDFLLHVLELFWPSFLEKDGYVFLKETFNEKEYNRLIKEGSSPEYWINLLTVSEFFSEMTDMKQKSNSLAKSLLSMWKAKLKNEFLQKNFIVEYLHDEKYEDYGLTFYQTNKNKMLEYDFCEVLVKSPKSSPKKT